ncbi:MAG: hypothetical protein JWM16_1447 [Verrucomicrobiales bacterium]|nr:hypothetical protein [Verrucomicrobiales bacterium]
MRQGNERELGVVPGNLPLLADDVFEFVGGEKLADGEPAHGDDEFRAENFHFGAQPFGTVLDFLFTRDAVTALGVLPRKAAADGGHVDALPEVGFGKAARFLEPAEEGLSGGPGEGTSENRLLVAGSLTDEENFAEDGSARNGGTLHAGAALALAELFHVQSKEAGGFGGCWAFADHVR